MARTTEMRRSVLAPVHVQRKCAKCNHEEEIEKKTAMPDLGVPQPKGEVDLDKQDAILKLVCPDCEDVLQAKEASHDGIAVSTELEEEIGSLKAGGQSLPRSVREFFEPKFAYDFSRVRVHTDARAAETARRMNALAYTTGPHIVFAPGQFAPHSDEGKKLLAHELTHVVQQSAAAPVRTTNAVQSRQGRSSTEPVQLLGAANGIHMRAASNNIFRHTAADCDRWYEECGDGCRSLPNRTRRDKARRALCWSACMSKYAACLASTDEAKEGVLTGLAIAGAIVLASADGPFPIGDAAAAALLGLVGIEVTD
jgi:hypothetical protein